MLSPSPSAISSNISTSRIRKISIPSGRVPLLTILVTPAHIGFLEDTPDFVPNVLRHLFEISREGQKFDVVAAVVDRIPYPIFPSEADQNIGQLAVEVTSPGTLIQDGSEGVSFAVLDSKSAAPNLWAPREEFKERETMTIQQRCTLSFAFPPTVVSASALLNGNEGTQPLVSRVLQLPVANTLFQNGKTSTLIAQRWRLQGEKRSSYALSCIREARLPQQILHMTDVFSNQGTGLEEILHSCLIPITPIRTVTAAVGNIVRRIAVDDTLNEDVPASEELERAISNAIKDGQLPAEQAGIWALVRPHHHSSDVDVGSTADQEIQQAVLSGCRLHKVLSGGGGWGEKQGLLALDPDYDYHLNQQTFEPSFGEDQDVESGKLQALGELVKPGDTVKFYVYRSPLSAGTTSESTSDHRPSSDPRCLSLSFGSLPSNMDAMPNVPCTGVDQAPESDCMVFNDHFGMLSEQGMSLESTYMETDLPASRVRRPLPNLLREDSAPFEVLSGHVLKTKLDAPYMTWSIKEEIHPLDLSSKENRDKSRSLGSNTQKHASRHITKTGATITENESMETTEIAPGSLDDFIDAMSNMPSHQHIDTMRPHPRKLHRAKAKAVGETSSEISAMDHEAAEYGKKPERQLFRKLRSTGVERGMQNVPLSMFGEVQSHFRILAKSFDESEVAIDQPHPSGTTGVQKDLSRVTGTNQQTPDSIAKPRSENMIFGDQVLPIRKEVSSLRILKHGARLPSVMHQRLASSVRRRIILEPWQSEEHDEDTQGSKGEDSSEALLRRDRLGGWDEWTQQKSENSIEPEIETVASKPILNYKIPQETMFTSQSLVGRGPLEHFGIPGPASKIDSRSSDKTIVLEGDSSRIKVVRGIEVIDRSQPVVRKHFSYAQLGEPEEFDSKGVGSKNPRARYNYEMAARRAGGLLQKKINRMPKPKVEIIHKDPTWDKSQESQGFQIKRHPSHATQPTDTRDKARKLHQLYRLPLLDERLDQAPRP